MEDTTCLLRSDSPGRCVNGLLSGEKCKRTCICKISGIRVDTRMFPLLPQPLLIDVSHSMSICESIYPDSEVEISLWITCSVV